MVENVPIRGACHGATFGVPVQDRIDSKACALWQVAYHATLRDQPNAATTSLPSDAPCFETHL